MLLLAIVIQSHYHSRHIVGNSSLPISAALLLFCLFTSTVVFFHFGLLTPMFYSVLVLCFLFFFWTSNIAVEEEVGFHRPTVTDGFKKGIALFIFSEVLFFVSFFWSWFDSSLSSVAEVGWVPIGIEPLDPFAVPLLNTAVLLSRGATGTFAHHQLLHNRSIFPSLFATILLGFYFTALQLFEYSVTSFSLSDGVYGTLFFTTTAFHGLHVIVGSLYLLTNLLWSIFYQLSSLHHIGLELALIYWHFVDVVWLFLFTFYYCNDLL